MAGFYTMATLAFNELMLEENLATITNISATLLHFIFRSYYHARFISIFDFVFNLNPQSFIFSKNILFRKVQIFFVYNYDGIVICLL